jgi:transposase-like protein
MPFPVTPNSLTHKVSTAADEAAAAAALEAFAGQWQGRYPAIVKLWRAHWNESNA